MSHKPSSVPFNCLEPEGKVEEPRLSLHPYDWLPPSSGAMGRILHAYMVPMSATLKGFFSQRLNQNFHMTLVNKCQVFYVDAQNILLRKVADSLILHTNKLRHGGINQDFCQGSTPYVHSSLWRPGIHRNTGSTCRDSQGHSWVTWELHLLDPFFT